MQADLLATAFSESIDRVNYKRFLERQILKYLRSSMTELSDDCVIFVAKEYCEGVLPWDLKQFMNLMGPELAIAPTLKCMFQCMNAWITVAQI